MIESHTRIQLMADAEAMKRYRALDDSISGASFREFDANTVPVDT